MTIEEKKAVLEVIKKSHCEEWVKAEIGAPIEALPSVNPQEPKTGHWIDKDEKSAVCSCCNRNNILFGDYCKWCGCRMVDPQERGEE